MKRASTMPPVSEPELVDHPPGQALAGAGNCAIDEDHDRGADQRGPRFRLELPRELRDEEGDDGERAGENDLLIVLDAAEPHAERERDETQAAAENPPVRRRAVFGSRKSLLRLEPGQSPRNELLNRPAPQEKSECDAGNG